MGLLLRVALIATLLIVTPQQALAHWVYDRGYVYRVDPDCAWMDVALDMHTGETVGEVWSAMEMDVYDSGGFYCDEQFYYWPGGMEMEIFFKVHDTWPGDTRTWTCDYSGVIANPEWQHLHEVRYL